jgi:ABC-2 type transport system ATP-binding protein
MISLRDVVKTYGQVQALAGVSLDVARGECLGIAGAAGSGRTTLLRILATLVRATSGAVVVDGRDAGAYPFEIRKRVTFVSATSVGSDRLLVEEHARFFAETRTVGRKGGAAASVRKALRRAGLAPGARLESLDSSDRMALALTTSFLAKADVFLLDEPFRPLADSRRALFGEWLIEANAAGTTMVIATGDDDDARRLCKRVLRLRAGKVVEEPS